MNANNTKNLTDEQLALALQNGHTTAMSELYSRYYLVVFNKCLSFTKNTDDAADLAQDVMIRVLEKIKSFKGTAKFSTWLYSITFNYCTDRQRKAKKKCVSSLELQFDLEDRSELSLAEALEMGMKEEYAGKVLSSIEVEDRELLLMKYQHNKSIQELQTIYKLSASAVKMRLLRARAKAVTQYNQMLQIAA